MKFMIKHTTFMKPEQTCLKIITAIYLYGFVSPPAKSIGSLAVHLPKVESLSLAPKRTSPASLSWRPPANPKGTENDGLLSVMMLPNASEMEFAFYPPVFVLCVESVRLESVVNPIKSAGIV